jgi:hypothetical protein
MYWGLGMVIKTVQVAVRSTPSETVGVKGPHTQTVRRNNPQHIYLHTCRLQNLNSHIIRPASKPQAGMDRKERTGVPAYNSHSLERLEGAEV